MVTLNERDQPTLPAKRTQWRSRFTESLSRDGAECACHTRPTSHSGYPERPSSRGRSGGLGNRIVDFEEGVALLPELHDRLRTLRDGATGISVAAAAS